MPLRTSNLSQLNFSLVCMSLWAENVYIHTLWDSGSEKSPESHGQSPVQPY